MDNDKRKGMKRWSDYNWKEGSPQGGSNWNINTNSQKNPRVLILEN